MDAPGLSLGSFSFPSTRERHQPQDNISVCFERRRRRRRRGGWWLRRRRRVVDQEGFRQSSGPHFLPQVLILCHIKELGLHLGHREAFS